MSDMFDVEEEIDLLAYDFDEVTQKLVRSEEPLASPRNLPAKINGSVTLIKTYLTCPAQAYARITRQEGSKGGALIAGISVHEVLEHIVTERVDPLAYYKKVFYYEAERNKMLTTSKDMEAAFATGQMCLNNALSEDLLGKVMKNGKKFYETLDPAMAERQFVVYRNGIRWTGKIDQLNLNDIDGEWSIWDYKSGKNAPNKFELDTDMQFTLYPWGIANDENFPVKGLWIPKGVYLHLRGKTIEKNENGTTSRKKGAQKQFAFPTTRTPADAEKMFTQTIDPVMEMMDKGYWPRNEGKACSWCSYARKDGNGATIACGAEIPYDQTGRDPNAAEEQARVKKAHDAAQVTQSLFNQAQLTESQEGKLKPYA